MTKLNGIKLILIIYGFFVLQINGIEQTSSTTDSPQSVVIDFNTFRCLSDDETNSNRNFFTARHQNTFGIQVSNRATHQLSSRIFAIFLREIFGYKNVVLVNIRSESLEENHKLFQTFNTMVAPFGEWAIPTLDLEVWAQPNYRGIPPQVLEAGLVTHPGRFGWFIPLEFNQYSNATEKNNSFVHYSVFQDFKNKQYSHFVVEDEILEQLSRKFGIKYEWSPEECQNRSCAILFAGHYTDTAFIRYHIQEFNFHVKVLWFEENYKLVVEWLLNRYRSDGFYSMNNKTFILLHWTPSDIIGIENQYDSIIMPMCEDMQSSVDTLCKYELTPLLKFCAVKLRSAKQAFWALKNFYLSRDEMRNLLLRVNQLERANSLASVENIYTQVACEWFKRSEKIYRQWIVAEDRKLTIGGIFPITGAGEAYRGIVPAAQMAVEAINRNDSVLPNFNVSVIIQDGQCQSDVVMRSFINYFSLLTPVIGVLGPACSETVEPIAGISKYMRMAMISYSAEGASFTDRENYPYFFQTIGSNRQYEAVYLNLLRRLDWNRVAALTEDGQKYTAYISHMESLLKENGMELILNKKFPKDISISEMNKDLLQLKNKRARIIIADVYNEVALSRLLCEAYRLEMTAYHGHTWFLPVWVTKGWMNGTKIIKMPTVTCTADELFQAINGHFALAHAPWASNTTIMEENKTTGEWLQDYRHRSSDISDYAGFAYDAVWVFALTMDKLIREDPTVLNNLRSPTVVKRFVELIWQIDFNGVSGRIRFGEGGSRINNVNILQWIDGTYRKIGMFSPTTNENREMIGGNLNLTELAITWLWKDGKTNDGTYFCSMGGLAEFLKTDCENITFILSTFLSFVLVIIVMFASYMFWKVKYDKKIKASAKVMRNFGIDLLHPSATINNTLDKWEIPKDKVVINRRLGEGAFGTVYGGEAQVNDSDWTAVAVKTLKAGSSTEDRLDFLSEAEAMKRFDHKNIVQLIGVCLQNEPIYTIMEFMLYGDLKTYLLARRHMVGEKITDDSDISSKRLTMMSLDIARGLSYLAAQKYIHRDVACRNCLVNAQKVAKLGDFGMSRPLFEDDCYRFNRKGMLPVRWMAPESLSLGMFTPLSDVWSFGILLHEIITFGSFPYQGLNNNEVLEYVKDGKTLQIPAGVKPPLEALMKACWSYEYKKRPSASEIVEYLSNYPRLLTPCLDGPLSSVQMFETDSDQMELLPRLRKRTSTQPTLDILSRSVVNNDCAQRCLDSNCKSKFHLNGMNVPTNSVSNDDNPSNAYNPMEPLIKKKPEQISLSKRYVAMCGSKHDNISNEAHAQNITSV